MRITQDLNTQTAYYAISGGTSLLVNLALAALRGWPRNYNPHGFSDHSPQSIFVFDSALSITISLVVKRILWQPLQIKITAPIALATTTLFTFAKYLWVEKQIQKARKRRIELERIKNEPKIKTFNNGNAASLEWIGGRGYMEDVHNIGQVDVNKKIVPFFIICDGHGGEEVAEQVSKALPTILETVFVITEDRRGIVEIDRFVEESFKKKHKLLSDRKLARARIKYPLRAEFAKLNFQFEKVKGGSCVLAAWIKDGQLQVANVGDCRAVLCKNGQPINMSQDAKASLDWDKERVEKGGGYIWAPVPNGRLRLGGELAVTRAFGDYNNYNNKLPLIPIPGLSTSPHLKSYYLSELDKNDSNILVLASDGLWDYFESDEIASLVSAFRSEGQSLEMIVSSFKRFVQRRADIVPETADNLTIILVDLNQYLT